MSAKRINYFAKLVTYNGETRRLGDWPEHLPIKIPYHVLVGRVKAQWPTERMLTELPREYAQFDPTPETDAIIAEAYRLLRQHGNRNAVSKARKRIGWTKDAFLNRARVLGLAQAKEKPWSQQEEQLLEKYAGFSDAVIWRKFREAGYSRSESAINVKIKRLAIRQNKEGWSVHQISQCLGIDDRKVATWIKAKMLPAVISGIVGGRCEKYFIAPSGLRRFVLNHPTEFDMRRIDPAFQLTFLDIVSGGKLCEEFKSEVAA